MPPQTVLVQFKADATAFLSAVQAMTQAMTGLNQQLGAVTQSNTGVANSTNQASASQEKMKASTIALGNIMAKVLMDGFKAAKKFTNSFAETGIEVRKLQMVMGGTAEEMSSLLAVFGAYRVPFDALIVSYRSFAIQATTNTKAFHDLGLSMKDANGDTKSATQLFMDAADALNNLDSATARTAAGGVLFGRRYKELMPVLALGSEGIRKVAENAKKLGLVLDEEGVKKAVAYTQTQTLMHQSMQGLSFIIMENLVPALTEMMKWFSQMIVGVKDYLKNNPGMVDNIVRLAKAFFFLWGIMKAVAIVQAVITGAEALGSIGAFIIKFGTWVTMTVLGYGSIATAASTAAAASASAWAMTGVGLLVVGAAVAGVAVLINKMMSNIKGVKLDTPDFQAAGDGMDQYDPSTGGTGGKTASEKALDRAKKHLDAVKKFWDAQVKAAKEALDATKEAAKKYQDMVKDISEAIRKSAEVPAMIEDSFAAYLGPSNLVRAFQQKVQDAKDFLTALTRLRDAKLDPAILSQLAVAGPQAGLQAARVILSDVSVIGQLNSLQAELASYAGVTGAMVGQYVEPASYLASTQIGGAQSAYDKAVAGQTAAVNAAQAQVNHVQVTVNSQTNANPQTIAKDTAWGAVTGITSGWTLFGGGKWVGKKPPSGPTVGPDGKPTWNPNGYSPTSDPTGWSPTNNGVSP